MWGEAVVATGLAGFAVYCVFEFVRYRNHDRHGGMYSLIFAVLLVVGALGVGAGATTLRRASRVGWFGQIFPAAVVAWVIWDRFGH